jgi:hypothetical protein
MTAMRNGLSRLGMDSTPPTLRAPTRCRKGLRYEHPCDHWSPARPRVLVVKRIVSIGSYGCPSGGLPLRHSLISAAASRLSADDREGSRTATSPEQKERAA